jgi:hypothetical protein
VMRIGGRVKTTGTTSEVSLGLAAQRPLRRPDAGRGLELGVNRVDVLVVTAVVRRIFDELPAQSHTRHLFSQE